MVVVILNITFKEWVPWEKKQLNKEFKKATNNEKMLFKHLKN